MRRRRSRRARRHRSRPVRWRRRFAHRGRRPATPPPSVASPRRRARSRRTSMYRPEGEGRLRSCAVRRGDCERHRRSAEAGLRGHRTPARGPRRIRVFHPRQREEWRRRRRVLERASDRPARAPRDRVAQPSHRRKFPRPRRLVTRVRRSMPATSRAATGAHQWDGRGGGSVGNSRWQRRFSTGSVNDRLIDRQRRHQCLETDGPALLAATFVVASSTCRVRGRVRLRPRPAASRFRREVGQPPRERGRSCPTDRRCPCGQPSDGGPGPFLLPVPNGKLVPARRDTLQ